MTRGNTKHSIPNRKVHSHTWCHTGYHQSAIGITPSLPLISNSLYIKYKQHKYFSNNKKYKLDNKNKTLKVIENISILFSPICSCFHNNKYLLSVFHPLVLYRSFFLQVPEDLLSAGFDNDGVPLLISIP